MNRDALMITMAMNAWNSYVERTQKFIDSISDEDFFREIAPGKNRVIYLVGHLIAIHDRMSELYSSGARKFSHYDATFVDKADKAVEEFPSVERLRKEWKDVHARLASEFSSFSEDAWFSRHAAVSEADFAREPYRNRLNLLMNRTSHLAYHFGQLLLLPK